LLFSWKKLFFHFFINLPVDRKKSVSKSVLKEYSDSKVEKDFLEFINIIVEAKLSIKFKNGNEKFRPRKTSLSISGLHEFSISKQEVPIRGNPFSWKICMTIFELVVQFYIQNDFFKLQEVFSEHGIRVFLENGLGSFQTFLI
jgi:hypothetical protein